MHDASLKDLHGWPRQPAPTPIPIGREWPWVSLVTPSLNQGRYIESTLLSVIHQGYPNLEYIVMDGGSTDGTLEILRRHEARLAHWESSPDRGQSDAINKGWRRATGTYVWWLNADDLLTPGSLFAAVEALESDRSLDFVYGDTLLLDQDDVIVGRFHYRDFDFVDFILNRRDLPQAGALMRRSTLDRIGLLDEGLHYLMDYDLWIRLALGGGRFARIDRALALFRLHEEAKTEAGSLRSVEERHRLHRWLLAHPGLPEEVRRQWPRVTGLMHLECERTAIRAAAFSAGLREAWLSARSWPAVLARRDLWYQLALGLLGLLLGPKAWLRLRERVRGSRRRRWAREAERVL
jgi:glycosyltransferase involved in cell wall biosynthesis